MTKPLLCACKDESGVMREYVVKLRHPDASEGHFEGTSLACELVCAVLARASGLLVPDYAVVGFPSALPFAVPESNPDLRQTIIRNLGYNFGALYHEEAATWPPEYPARSDALLAGLEDVLAFDAAVINGDRRAIRPNLLWRGDQLWAIDHSLALPVHRWSPTERALSPMLPEAQVRNHCTYMALHERGRMYDAMFGRWGGEISHAELDTLRGWLPPSWEQRSGDVTSIFDFLKGRAACFVAVTHDLRRVMR
jgi:hypothetical protein